MPMWQAEAMWISFGGGWDGGWGGGWERPPFAVTIAAGKINAVTGQPWREGLSRDPQDYVVLPDQPWLDGFCVAKGEVRQFVAMRLGQGFTAEEQITGAAAHGGLQIAVTPLTPDAFARWAEERRKAREWVAPLAAYGMPCPARLDIGLAPGGRMRQHIYPDRRPLTDWDTTKTRRVFVTLLDAVTWKQATGEPPPFRPPSAKDYAAAGMPWFDWYGDDLNALGGAAALAGLKSVAELGGLDDEANADVEDNPKVALGPKAARPVREPAAP
jgi:hypothetical protein